jgi:AbiV family abortive infection protein
MKANNNFYLEGYNLALENSECLFKVACQAANENIFGVACSLNILSAEEAIKAVCLIINHFAPNCFKSSKNLKLIFKDHKTKHDSLKAFLQITNENINKQAKRYLDILEEEKERNKNIPIELILLLNEFGKDVHDVGKVILELSKDKFDIEEALNWLKNTNNEKNDGLYVDEKNSQWKTPQSFKFETYEKEKKFSEMIIKYARNLEYLYNYINKKDSD